LVTGVAGGVSTLLDEPRSGAPRRITDEQVDATHWSVRSLASATGMSRQVVHRIWKAFGLQPHRSETFNLSTDPQLIEKIRDIVGLYLDPPERALVLCTDEKSQIQALDRTGPILPMRPGQVERRTYDYKRHGTHVVVRRSGRGDRQGDRRSASSPPFDRVPQVPGLDRCRGAERRGRASRPG
jgi:hypothetical protein